MFSLRILDFRLPILDLGSRRLNLLRSVNLKSKIQNLKSIKRPLPFVEGRFNDASGDFAPANDYGKFRADTRVFNRQVKHADVLFQVRRVAAGGDGADLLTVDRRRVAI